jgi:hypothetical protein
MMSGHDRFSSTRPNSAHRAGRPRGPGNNGHRWPGGSSRPLPMCHLAIRFRWQLPRNQVQASSSSSKWSQSSRAFITPSMMFQTGPIRSINPASSPAAVLTGQPVPLRGLGGGHQHLHTLGRRERAGDRVIDAHAGALALVPLAVLLETCMQVALAQPHIHHQIIDHKRIDAGSAGRPWLRAAGHLPGRSSIRPAGGNPRWSGLPTMPPRATWERDRPSRVRVGP